MDKLLTTKELQKLLKIDQTTVYRMLKDGRLTGIKMGRLRRRIKPMRMGFWAKTAVPARLNFSLDSLLLAVFGAVNLSGLTLWLVLTGGGYRGGRNLLHRAVLFGLTRPIGLISIGGWAW